MQAVERGKEYIYDGDVIQVVLSQRFSRALSPALCEQPFNLYRALRYLNPSPYMYYLSYGEVKIIGSSPERLVSEEDGTVVTRPIAGTRKRGATPAGGCRAGGGAAGRRQGARGAYHAGRPGAQRPGPRLRVRHGRRGQLMVIEYYSHVMHIVSNVRGTLRDGPRSLRRAARLLPGGHGERRAEDPRHADHR